jgi:septation ring formation regulator EzrA
MNKKLLIQKINESLQSLSELEVQPDMDELVEKFGSLSDEIDRLKATLKSLEIEYRKYSDILKPLLKEVDSTQDVALQTKRFLITVKKKGYEYNRVGYEEAFDTLYSKVNPALKKIADKIKEANTTIVKVAPKLGVQRIEKISEINLINTLKDKFISYINSLSNKIDYNTDTITSAIDEFKSKLLRKK